MPTNVTSKGQVTIPKRVRDALGLKPGSRVEFLIQEGGVVLAPAREGVEGLAGSLRKYLRKGVKADDGDPRTVRHPVQEALP